MQKGRKMKQRCVKEGIKISRSVTISMIITVVISILFTAKASAFYDIDGLIRQVNQEIQNFVSSFESQINEEISTHRNNLQRQLDQEIENYEKSLTNQANIEVEQAKEEQISESELLVKKRCKESNDRINKAKEKAAAELEEAYEAYRSLDLMEE